MIKAMLVDDDVEMLQGLENIIPWEEYGFSIAAKAENGCQALNMIPKIMPDVLITDITMPAMNGLELISKARKLKPDIRSVIISCHEIFSYAQEAIRLQADEYIIKHTLTEEELIAVINSLKVKIENHRGNRHAILERFYNELIEKENLTRDELVKKAELNGISLPEGGFRLVSLFVDNPDEILEIYPAQDNSLFRMKVLNIMDAALDGLENISAFSCSQNVFSLLYLDNLANMPVKQKMISLVKDIQGKVYASLGIKLSVCFSTRFHDILQLGKAAKETAALRDAYFFRGSGEIITEEGVMGDGEASELLQQFRPGLRNLVCMNKQPEVKECISELFTRLASGTYAVRSVKILLGRLIDDIVSVSWLSGLDIEPFKIRGYTLDIYRKSINGLLDRIFKSSPLPLNSTTRPEVRRVTDYVKMHLDDDISCESMAAFVNMNSSYFSRLFKNETGMSFSGYLFNLRMKTATELLNNSDLTIEEIARAIGIESPSYFHRAYKRITGYTPGDVRSMSRMGQIKQVMKEQS